MKILLVCPRYADTLFNFTRILNLISKKAIYPPLGLLTVAAMLPEDWNMRLVDMNAVDLKDDDLAWADTVFISAMQVQRDSVKDVIARCRKLKKTVVAGGPLFTASYDEFEGVDHFVLGEAESILAPFLSDLQKGVAKPEYRSSERPDISSTPIPLWSLINLEDYGTMTVQYSRGCPFDCEFCDIVFLNGHAPRTKEAVQLLGELDALYTRGWRGQVFFVDDNFIGNKKKLKAEVLPAVLEWQKARDYPFYFMTQASVNLADDEELMQLMARAGFSSVFVGVESPNEQSLDECGKTQNSGRDLLASVKSMQNHGLEVMGGFVVGFDSDPASIFDSQIDFIRDSGIILAMVNTLNAPRGTRLYERLKAKNRLLDLSAGGIAGCNTNFVPSMDYDVLVSGFKRVLREVYSPRAYYHRVIKFYSEYRPVKTGDTRISLNYVTSLMRCLWVLGIAEDGRGYFWRLLAVSALKYRQFFWRSVIFSIYRLHLNKYSRMVDASPSHAVGGGMPLLKSPAGA